jgi:hypothetical protein
MPAMLVHNEIPEKMIRVLLVPVIKAKNGDVSSSDNYRPIAAVLNKIIEHVMLKGDLYQGNISLTLMYIIIRFQPTQQYAFHTHY